MLAPLELIQMYGGQAHPIPHARRVKLALILQPGLLQAIARVSSITACQGSTLLLVSVPASSVLQVNIRQVSTVVHVYPVQLAPSRPILVPACVSCATWAPIRLAQVSPPAPLVLPALLAPTAQAQAFQAPACAVRVKQAPTAAALAFPTPARAVPVQPTPTQLAQASPTRARAWHAELAPSRQAWA